MTDARPRSFWHRAGPLAALGALAAIAAAQGCSGEPEKDPLASKDPSFDLAANGLSPFDTTPDPEGKTLYFTALSRNADNDDVSAGVFSAPADGSSPNATPLAMGTPFVTPVGISISGDGKQLFVADPGADSGQEKGAIFVVPSGGGTPTILAGTEDVVPRSLDIVKEDGKDIIYFTGTDKSDGLPGVFKIPISGGAATVVAKGDPFRDPSGITVSDDGKVYVADTISSEGSTASILVVSGGTATPLLPSVRVGYPAGVAVTKEGGALFVSALDPEKLTDIVINVDLATMKQTTIAPDTINTFSESAGLHRARNANVFGWADSSAGESGAGKVFLVK